MSVGEPGWCRDDGSVAVLPGGGPSFMGARRVAYARGQLSKKRCAGLTVGRAKR
jgi:hypothetical protein